MIDTHCHIDDSEYANLEEVVLRQQEAGVKAILVPGVNVGSCETVLAACRQFPGYLYPALGLHPEDVKADWQEQLATIYEVVKRGKLVAIGEIGLDYHWDTTYKEEQKQAFREQLRWAKQLDLPVMIHGRDAVEDMVQILREELPAKDSGEHPLRGVVHCFSGSYEVAKEYIKMGLYLGIGGVITFKNCKLAENLCPSDGRERIPLDRLMLETDAPYMSPVPFRGQPNESRYMAYVVKRLAETYDVTENDVICATNCSATQLFCLK